MTEPRRLLQEGADDFEARLLYAGRRDAMTLASRRRVLMGLSLAGLLPGSALAAVAPSGTKSGLLLSGFGGAAKWVAGGIAGTVAVWAGTQGFDRNESNGELPRGEHPPAMIADFRSDEASEAEPPRPQIEPVAEEAPQVALPAEPETKPVPVRAATKGSLGLELSHIEDARRALQRGSAARALRLLDEHQRRFPKPALRSEATVLRIEALVMSGADGSAERIGKQFLAKHRNGPYAKRVRSLIGEPQESENPR